MNQSTRNRYRPAGRRSIRGTVAVAVAVLATSVTARADGPAVTPAQTDAAAARLEAAAARLDAAAARMEAATKGGGAAAGGGGMPTNTAPTEPPPPFPPATPNAVIRVSRDVGRAVVRIDTAQEIYERGKRSVQRGIGSGVIFDADGRILTNFHVAGRSVDLYVTLANKERLPAKLIGDDHWTDLAVIQMDMDEVRKRKTSFEFAKFGTSATALTGQDVMAIGTPFGLNRTMTLGQISNNERTFYPERMTIDLGNANLETGDFSNWLQMDTPINPGNSGGPLVDLDGNVVGINTRGGGQNLNFAIPIDTAKPVIASILRTAGPNKKGRVDRSDLGIDLKPLQDLETFYKIDINKGVLVNSVDGNGAAKKAGLQSQDILLSVNGTATNCRFPEEVAAVRKMIADLPIGSDAALVALRDGKPTTFTAKTLKLQSVYGDEKELKVWGLTIRAVTRAYANDAQLDDDQGVAIESLTDGHPAADAELQPGDVIRAVDQHPVTDFDEFMRLYKDAIAAKEAHPLLDIHRGHGDLSRGLNVTFDTTTSDRDAKADRDEKPTTQNTN